MKRLTPRLAALLAEVQPARSLLDVGCDHGLVPLAALSVGIVERAVVTDVSKKSLAKAERALREAGFAGRVQSFCTDGMSGVPGPIDQAIVAGMGGREIVGILTRAAYKPNRLILQPMRDVAAVRIYLIENGYDVARDYIVESEDKYYDVIVALKSDAPRPLSERETRYGRTDLAGGGEVFRRYLRRRQAACRDLLSGPLPEERRRELAGELAEMEDILHAFETGGGAA